MLMNITVQRDHVSDCAQGESASGTRYHVWVYKLRTDPSGSMRMRGKPCSPLYQTTRTGKVREVNNEAVLAELVSAWRALNP